MRDYRIIARQTLADYLASENSGDPSIKVYASWPKSGDDLQQTEITIVSPGGSPRIIPHQPKIWSYVSGTAVYSYALIEIDLQIDLWTGFETVRDELSGTLEAQLNRPPQVTIAGSLFPRLGRAQGLSLRSAELFNSVITYRFLQCPATPETDATVSEDHWRAIWQGTATMHALAQSTVPALTDLQIALSVNDEDSAIIISPTP